MRRFKVVPIQKYTCAMFLSRVSSKKRQFVQNLHIPADDGKTYQVQRYNLDVVIRLVPGRNPMGTLLARFGA